MHGGRPGHGTGVGANVGLVVAGGSPGATGAGVRGNAVGSAVGRRVGERVRWAMGDSVACKLGGAVGSCVSSAASADGWSLGAKVLGLIERATSASKASWSTEGSAEFSAIGISTVGMLGVSDGSKVGQRVGCTELHSSVVDGDSVGESEGDGVTCATRGSRVRGTRLGFRDGDVLGRCDGDNVEVCVGSRVGENDGCSDVYSVGADGASVGTPEGV